MVGRVAASAIASASRSSFYRMALGGEHMRKMTTNAGCPRGLEAVGSTVLSIEKQGRQPGDDINFGNIVY